MNIKLTMYSADLSSELSLPFADQGVRAGFMKEYRNTGNGYYYLLINDNTMIGYDID